MLGLEFSTWLKIIGILIGGVVGIFILIQIIKAIKNTIIHGGAYSNMILTFITLIPFYFIDYEKNNVLFIIFSVITFCVALNFLRYALVDMAFIAMIIPIILVVILYFKSDIKNTEYLKYFYILLCIVAFIFNSIISGWFPKKLKEIKELCFFDKVFFFSVTNLISVPLYISYYFYGESALEKVVVVMSLLFIIILIILSPKAGDNIGSSSDNSTTSSSSR